jgi:hypothetical protein
MVASESSHQCLVRYGWQATVAKFELDPGFLESDIAAPLHPERPEADNNLPHSDASRFGQKQTEVPRLHGQQVVIQTPRGIEMGTILRKCQPDSKPMGRVLRPMRPEDELLNRHLKMLGQTAYQRCTKWLEINGNDAVLLEVEPLMDCRTLLFHFMTGVDDVLQQHVDHLITVYESEVAASEFVRKVIDGCGPGCGTTAASGSGCGSAGGCSQCSIGCGLKKRG